jgi:ABC-type lipoprotein release transport system permease subunit
VSPVTTEPDVTVSSPARQCLKVDFPEMTGYIALAGLAALLASVIPARRAARLSVIDGLAAD